MWYHMNPFERSKHPIYLEPEILAKATRLFDKAERLVANDPERLERVEVARLSLDYVKLHLLARLNAMNLPQVDGVSIRTQFLHAMDEFFTTAKRNGVEYMRESSRPESSMEEFREYLEKYLDFEDE